MFGYDIELYTNWQMTWIQISLCGFVLYYIFQSKIELEKYSFFSKYKTSGRLTPLEEDSFSKLLSFLMFSTYSEISDLDNVEEKLKDPFLINYFINNVEYSEYSSFEGLTKIKIKNFTIVNDGIINIDFNQGDTSQVKCKCTKLIFENANIGDISLSEGIISYLSLRGVVIGKLTALCRKLQLIDTSVINSVTLSKQIGFLEVIRSDINEMYIRYSDEKEYHPYYVAFDEFSKINTDSSTKYNVLKKWTQKNNDYVYSRILHSKEMDALTKENQLLFDSTFTIKVNKYFGFDTIRTINPILWLFGFNVFFIVIIFSLFILYESNVSNLFLINYINIYPFGLLDSYNIKNSDLLAITSVIENIRSLILTVFLYFSVVSFMRFSFRKTRFE